MIHDPERVKRIRADVARGLEQAEKLKVVEDSRFREELRLVEKWFNDVENIHLKWHENPKRVVFPGQEALWLDGADMTLKMSFDMLSALQQRFDHYGPGLTTIG